MRFFLVFAILALFFASFWWSGGHTLPDTAATHLQQQWAQQRADHPTLAATADGLGKAYDSAYRLVALRSAVKEKLSETQYAPLSQISLPLQQAVIAVEDARFYTHMGVDPEGILRAGLVNLQSGHVEEGGSTITQQLVKNLFLTHEQSLGRKAEELALALDMEARYTKEEILALYLNTIYFGSGFTGITQASMGYFAKLPGELTLAESALLAGLPNAPSLLSPYVDYEAAKRRQSIVLNRMVKCGYINPSLAEAAKKEPLRLAR